MGIMDELRMQWRAGGMTVKLILANVGVFVALVLTYLLFLIIAQWDGGTALMMRHVYVEQWLTAPSNLGDLAIRPWTVFTYMFTHTGVGHIFWNMILLWLGGRLFEDLLGGKRLLGYYILGGLAGFLLFAVLQNVAPGAPKATVMGASAGVISVLVGIAAYRPQMVVNLFLFGPVKLMYVAGVILILDLMGIGTADGVAHEAHIGGALFGILASRQLAKGNDWATTFIDGMNRIAGLFKPKSGSRMRVEKPFTQRPPRNDKDYNATKQAQQARIDSILDKISKSGYDSLSKDEKDILFKEGK